MDTLPSNPQTLLLLLTLTTCSPPPKTDLQPAFYHWQTELSLDTTEMTYLEALGTRRLYVKFFDVDWDGTRRAAVPQASLLRKEVPSEYDIVPTVFLTNRTFKNLSAAARTQLTESVLQKVEELWPGLEYPELQLDCDWSGTTQAAYFDFLTALRQRLPTTTQLSVTLRLHQYRYPELTGVPPADRAMLMFYNMGDLTDWEELNSILNLEKARPYLATEQPYPLPLDLALPLFRWGVLFREGKMIKLLPEIDAADLRSVGGVALEGSANRRFQIPESTYLEGYYLYAGDRIRLEMVTPQQLREAAVLLRGIATGKQAYLAFYHLDNTVVKGFAPSDLNECFELLNEHRE